MKIKIITLLNKIANNEKVPKYILLTNIVFHYDDDVQDYENDSEYLFRDIFSNFDRSEDFLNLELEIIEEEKVIEKINYEEHIGIDLSEAVCNKINELVDEINKLKKEIEKENR